MILSKPATRRGLFAVSRLSGRALSARAAAKLIRDVLCAYKICGVGILFFCYCYYYFNAPRSMRRAVAEHNGDCARVIRIRDRKQ